VSWLLLGSALAAGLVYVVREMVPPRSLYPLVPFRYDFFRRRKTFRKALDLCEKRSAKTLVETGSARGGLAKSRSDGASTVVFGLWAKKHGATLHSVDVTPESIEGARIAVREAGAEASVQFHLQDSIAFLRGFQEPVDLLYLDSYDFDVNDPDVQRASQEHQLAEFKTIESRLHEGTVVLLDDCKRLPNGGKGKLTIPYMLDHGWKTACDSFQVLLVRK
jgi:hypothetical protein